MEMDFLEMRNKMSLMFFMMNVLFIIIIFSLQYFNVMNGVGFFIFLLCYDLISNKFLLLELILMFFMVIFGIVFLIQFIFMFFY